HPAPVVTVNDPVPPDDGSDCETGERAYVHGAAACVTVNVCPPTVIVPVRALVALLAATLNVTVPLSVPLGVPVTVTQLTPLVAVQLHPAPVVTVKDPVPPDDGSDCEIGESAYVHGAAACVTVNVCPPTVIVPVRALVALLAATLNVTVPLSVPLGVPVTVTQLTPLVAVQLHPAPVVTVKDPVPPPDGSDCEIG